MNRIGFLRVFISACLLLCGVSAFPDSYRIISTNPDGTSIRIGDKTCGTGDVFTLDDVIYWDDDIPNQGIIAVSVEHPGRMLLTSRALFRSKASDNMSIMQFNSLISKGAHDFYIMESDGGVIRIAREGNESVTYHLAYWRGSQQRIVVDVSEQESLSYSINGREIKELPIIDKSFLLTAEMFDAHDEIVDMTIYIESPDSFIPLPFFSLKIILI